MFDGFRYVWFDDGVFCLVAGKIAIRGLGESAGLLFREK